MKVLVTGANGFVGRAMCNHLEANGHEVVHVVRRTISAGEIAVGEIGAGTGWSSAIACRSCTGKDENVEAVVHLAARVHVMADQSSDPLAEFHRVNVDGSLNLARQAAAAGVGRFVFISTVKVNGEETFPGRPFTEDAFPAPQGAYAISKLEAELGLQAIARETGMEVVIIRPPLVYGPGVKANFLTMMRWLDRGIPLPLGAIRNRRSLLALDNLVDFIITCVVHPAAANQVFLVSDGEDLSTTDLLRRTATALGKPARLLPVSREMVTLGLKLVGKNALAQRLCGSLQMDSRKARNLLGWRPSVGVDEALLKTAEHFKEQEWR